MAAGAGNGTAGAAVAVAATLSGIVEAKKASTPPNVPVEPGNIDTNTAEISLTAHISSRLSLLCVTAQQTRTS